MSVLFNLQTLGQQKNKIIDCYHSEQGICSFFYNSGWIYKWKMSLHEKKNFGSISVTVVVNSTFSWIVVNSTVSWMQL